MNRLEFATTIVAQTWLPFYSNDEAVLINVLGWTLIHFVWQGLLIVGCTAFLLNALKKGTAHLRYVVACSGLLVAAMVPVITFPLLLQHALGQSSARLLYTPQSFGSVPWTHSPANPDSKLQLPGPQAEKAQVSVLSPSETQSGEVSSISPGTAAQQWDSFLHLTVWGWTAGVFFYFVRLLGGLYKVHLWKMNCQPVAEPAIIRLSDELRRRMHINSAVGVVGIGADLDTCCHRLA